MRILDTCNRRLEWRWKTKIGVFKDGVWRLDYDGNYLGMATVIKVIILD